MFFRSRKRRTSGGGVSPTSDPAGSEAGKRQSQQWDTWRCAAQKVTRAWNEWLAAGSRERPELYRCYVCALVEEAQAAAELEHTVCTNAQNAGDSSRSAARAAGTLRAIGDVLGA